MSNFLPEMTKLLGSVVKKIGSDLQQLSANFGKIIEQNIKVYSSDRLNGNSPESFAPTNHEHDYVRVGEFASSTMKLHKQAINNIALKNHDHGFVKRNELLKRNNENVNLIPRFFDRFKVVEGIGIQSVLCDEFNYYISVLPELTGIKFVYNESFDEYKFIEINFVANKPKLRFLMKLVSEDKEYTLELLGTDEGIFGNELNQIVQKQLSSFKTIIYFSENQIKIKLTIGDEVIIDVSALETNLLSYIEIKAQADELSLLRFNTPDVYVLMADVEDNADINYVLIDDTRQLNGKTKNYFSDANHNHDGIYERNKSIKKDLRVAQNSNLLAMSQGDIADKYIFAHPTTVFAPARHYHYNNYVRKHTRVIKASKIVSNKGFASFNEFATTRHQHDYVTISDEEYALKIQKQPSSVNSLLQNRLKCKLIRYKQTFKEWPQKVIEFYSSKHIPKNIVGENLFPNLLTTTTIDVTRLGVFYPELTEGCGFGVSVCRNAAYGPNPEGLLTQEFANMLKIDTFWECPQNPYSLITLKFNYINNEKPVTTKTFKPTRYHVVFTSKEKYEELLTYARGKLIVDSTKPVKKQAIVTFYESISSSAEKAKQSAKNVIPNVITETSGSYWVPLLPRTNPKTDDSIEQFLHNVASWLDSFLYFSYALILAFFAFIQMVILQIHVGFANLIAGLGINYANDSNHALCVCGISFRNLLLDIGRFFWNKAVEYLETNLFVPSISIKLEDGLIPVIFYRTRPTPNFTLNNTDFLDPYPLNPLYPEEFPGTIAVNQGYGTTIGSVMIQNNKEPLYVFSGAFQATDTDPTRLVKTFADNYIRYFGVLGRYDNVSFAPYSEQIENSWAVLVSSTLYSAQEVGFGVSTSKNLLTVINCGHPFNLLVLEKGE